MGRLFIRSAINDVAMIDIKLNLGSLQEPYPGVANVLIPLWRMTTYAKELERMGVSISFEKGLDALTLRAKARYAIVGKAIGLITKMIQNPSLDRINDAVREAKTSIMISREDTTVRSVAEALRILFKEHPYSRHPTAYDYRFDEITINEVRNSLDKLGVLSMTIVAPEDVVDVDLPTVNYTRVVPREFGSGSEDIRLEGKVQTTVVIAYPTYDVMDLEGSFRMSVLNTVLGGMGLISRLYQEVRVKRGLAYYAYSMYWALGSSGVLIAMAGVRREVLREATDIMLNTMSNFSIMTDELGMAVRNRVGRLKVMKESPEGIASLYSIIPTYGLPSDYYDRYIKYISGLRPEDISNEVKNLMKLRPTIVSVG
ncbi:MAG: M16 family metallopeptidase [Vulcanisaeta sp.]